MSPRTSRDPASSPAGAGADDRNAKVLVTVVALAAAFVAQRAVRLAWSGVTGTKPPTSRLGDPGDTKAGTVAAWAAVSAGTVALAQAWASTRARRYVARSREQAEARRDR